MVLDHSTLVQKAPGFETTFRPVTKCGERICQLSVMMGEKAKGIKRYGHIQEEGPGLHFLISLPFQWAICALLIN